MTAGPMDAAVEARGALGVAPASGGHSAGPFVGGLPELPEAPSQMEAETLGNRLLVSLAAQGFTIRDGALVPPDPRNKEGLRALHQVAVDHNRTRSRAGLERHERRLLSFVANGEEVVPERIRPRLVEVEAGSEEELLFRYARLHWSIPVSAGYGRRLRFVIYDDSNGKLIGIFGLGDPIFGLKPRDRWIGWDYEARRQRLQCVMDLFALGAIPPYSYLLCGKLVALLATSQPVIERFAAKYGGRQATISPRPLDGRLALLTTTSALGRSSLYNRLRYGGDRAFRSVGFTCGTGEFQFTNGVYAELRAFAGKYCDATAKHDLWGSGFRNRRELVRKTLPLLGLSRGLARHGVGREIFVAPLAGNTQAFLRGEDAELRPERRSPDRVFEWFRERWLLPRAARDRRFLHFRRDDYRLWEAA